MNNRTEARESLNVLLACSAVTLILWFIPYADLLVYPFRIFVTLIHEAAHAAAAFLTFGRVHHIEVGWNGNGLTTTQGGIRLFISSAGYIGTALYGSALLLLVRQSRHARATALVSGVLLLVMTILLAGNLLAWIAGLAFGAALLAIAIKGSRRLIQFVMSFLAVQCLLNAFYDLKTLMYLSVFEPGWQTDAHNMAAETGGLVPAIVWAVGWALVSLAILTVTLATYYKSVRSSHSY